MIARDTPGGGSSRGSSRGKCRGPSRGGRSGRGAVSRVQSFDDVPPLIPASQPRAGPTQATTEVVDMEVKTEIVVKHEPGVRRYFCVSQSQAAAIDLDADNDIHPLHAIANVALFATAAQSTVIALLVPEARSQASG